MSKLLNISIPFAIKKSRSKTGIDDSSPVGSAPKYHGLASLATTEFQNFRKSSTQGSNLRNGTVLTRRSILKMDHFHRGINLEFDNLFVGAPNFRQTEMNIFGVAQPTTVGLATILSLLECAPFAADSSTILSSSDTINSSVYASTQNENALLEGRKCTWFCTREEPIIYINEKPYVLREEDSPLKNITTCMGISAERLEQLEQRLKQEIVKEASRNNNLILVHDELVDGRIIPFWVVADRVQTPREVFESFSESGFRVSFHRIPISTSQAPSDKYVDEIINIIKDLPVEEIVVFNCGIGVGRTTYNMITACLIRRMKWIRENRVDPFLVKGGNEDVGNKAILRLVYALERGLNSKMSPRSAIEWALARSSIIDTLKDAIQGNYKVILELASVLDDGIGCKKIVDLILDRCDALVNIREDILMNRVRYSLQDDSSTLDLGISCLERYFSLIAFSAYVQEQDKSNFSESFTSWLRKRTEIWGMFQNFRRPGPKLQLFRPCEDLSSLDAINLRKVKETGSSRNLAVDEPTRAIIKNRSGSVLGPHTILKIDHWQKRQDDAIAMNFRKTDEFHIFGVAQPTLSAVSAVIDKTISVSSLAKVIWINLREEPVIYIHGEPYVLRDQYATLRNIQAFSGISPERLELMEFRLKEDVIAESRYYNNRILLQSEASDGSIVPGWVDLSDSQVHTIREVFDSEVQRCKMKKVQFNFFRLPLTAEEAPEPSQFDSLMKIIVSADIDRTSFVMNCQMGSGRSTLGMVICMQILHWIHGTTNYKIGSQENVSPVHMQYPIIHSLLRVIRNGLECKSIVDDCIDKCAQIMNLRVTIDNWRTQADQANEENIIRRAIQKGIQYLKRYFMLICFQAYLDQTMPDQGLSEIESFGMWLKRHAEIVRMLDELEDAGAAAHKEVLLPVHVLQPGEGIALTTEVLDVVRHRRGSVLASYTILKYDHFPGCQKLSLTERMDGAPNYRRVALPSKNAVYGIGMPTKAGLLQTLKHIKSNNSDKTRKLVWTCLREEPVIFVNGKPFVLRTFQDPLSNLETTGIVRERVELMEKRMKADILSELSHYNGQLLLHEEEVLQGGSKGDFSIVPIWEHVDPKDVETTLEVFEAAKAKGFDIDYLRIPITDEQAPIPNVFDQLIQRFQLMNVECDGMFNCQMGRGRTTTGMVIALMLSLVSSLHGNHESLSHMLFESNKLETLVIDEGDEPMEHGYKRGEYRIIIKLLAVLEHGKLAKGLADYAIDKCEQVQNLRHAILDYKTRLFAMQNTTSKKFGDLAEVALNYLMRYFYLIAFADYLLECYSVGYEKITFVKWLESRQEIIFLTKIGKLDLQQFE